MNAEAGAGEGWRSTVSISRKDGRGYDTACGMDNVRVAEGDVGDFTDGTDIPA
jgi:hypothetical protein